MNSTKAELWYGGSGISDFKYKIEVDLGRQISLAIKKQSTYLRGCNRNQILVLLGETNSLVCTCKKKCLNSNQ